MHTVIDAKDKDFLQPKDVDQIIDYKDRTKARITMIYVASDTEIPPLFRIMQLNIMWRLGVAESVN